MHAVAARHAVAANSCMLWQLTHACYGSVRSLVLKVQSFRTFDSKLEVLTGMSPAGP